MTQVDLSEHQVTQTRRAALTDPITVTPVRGKISCLTGSGGNVTVLAERDEVLLVDSGMVGQRVADALARVTSAPVRYLVNTHWHFDHTDANVWMAGKGAAIIAHQNTSGHLSRTTYVKDYDYSFPALPPAGRPRVAVTDEYTVKVGGRNVALRHYGPAHTDGDLSVRFEEEDVLAIGDTWWNGVYPFIDYSTGGSLDGLIAATEWNLAASTPTTLLVPGHGSVGGRNELQRYYDMLVTVRDRVAQLRREGRTSLEVIAAKPTASFDADWAGGFVGAEFFVKLVYQGV